MRVTGTQSMILSMLKSERANRRVHRACARRCSQARVIRRTWWVLLLCLTLSNATLAEDNMHIGDPAPDFSLPDQHGATRTLAEFRGRWLVLYFYPKNDTPGCTTEACQFRDDYLGVKALGAEILGVSVDNRDSHSEFAKKYSLPFALLADTDGLVAKQYGALWDMWVLRWAKRHTFLIDAQGRIAKIYRDVDPKTHSAEIIADLGALQRAASR